MCVTDSFVALFSRDGVCPCPVNPELGDGIRMKCSTLALQTHGPQRASSRKSSQALQGTLTVMLCLCVSGSTRPPILGGRRGGLSECPILCTSQTDPQGGVHTKWSTKCCPPSLRASPALPPPYGFPRPHPLLPAVSGPQSLPPSLTSEMSITQLLPRRSIRVGG